MSSTPSNRAHRVAVSAFFFLFGFLFASWASRIPAIQQKLALSETELGMVLFSLPVGLLVSLPISGWLVTKKGSKTVACFAAIFYALLLVTMGLAASKVQLMAALFAFGLAGNMGNISFNTQAVNVEALYGRTIMASFHGVWSLAGFTGAAFGTFLTGAAVAPATHFLIALVIAIIIISVAAPYLVKNDIKANEQVPLFALPGKSLLTLGLIAFCSMLCEGAMFDWSGVYFKKVVMAKPSLVGAGYTGFMCTMAISRFVADYFTFRYGFKRVVQVSGVIIFSGLLIAVLLPAFYTATMGFLLVGTGVSSIVPLVYS
ncbi:MAG: MFS transporter, partial [Bacteroidota bacterium]|nr:MFS transporter [Bacteroidota bacterium]